MLIATTNRHKLTEWSQLLEALLPGASSRFGSLIQHAGYVQPPEDGDTFIANATIKAVDAARTLNCWALADDSGICVQALEGAPGVYSARYAGEGATDATNRAKLLKAMEGKKERQAAFVCAVAIAAPGGDPVHIFEGFCQGHLLDHEEGSQGFGYDPLFVPNGFQQTFAQMDSEQKHRISHRRNALQEALLTIEAVLKRETR